MTTCIVNQKDLNPKEALVFYLILEALDNLTNDFNDEGTDQLDMAYKIASDNQLYFTHIFKLAISHFYKEMEKQDVIN